MGQPSSALAVGDVIRHPKGGIGIVEAREDGTSLLVRFVGNRGRVGSRRTELVYSRLELLIALESAARLEPDQRAAALIALRIDDAELFTAAAAFFACATDPDVRLELRRYLTSLGPSRRDAVDARLADAAADLKLPTRLRGVARRPGESVEARIERIDARLARAGAPPLTPAQVRRLHDPYRSHCWLCHGVVDADSSIPCPECLWFICRCGACKSSEFGSCNQSRVGTKVFAAVR